MIRLISFTIGGHVYLNFMGNEFGHPKVKPLSLQYPLTTEYIQLTIVLLAPEGRVPNAK